MKTWAIVQARCGSTRLPHKVLAPIRGRPMLAWVISRLSEARLLDGVMIATTTRIDDDAIADLCGAEHWPCYRGDEHDVLDRYYRAASDLGCDSVVRVTSDCPLIDPAVVDLVIATYQAASPAVDYASNTQRRTYPRGLDAEVFSMNALSMAWREDTDPGWREHVTPYLYRTDRFRRADVVNSTDWSHLRWTVDTHDDLALVCAMFDYFGDRAFTWQEAIHATLDHPDWQTINASVAQKPSP